MRFLDAKYVRLEIASHATAGESTNSLSTGDDDAASGPVDLEAAIRLQPVAFARSLLRHCQLVQVVSDRTAVAEHGVLFLNRPAQTGLVTSGSAGSETSSVKSEGRSMNDDDPWVVPDFVCDIPAVVSSPDLRDVEGGVMLTTYHAKDRREARFHGIHAIQMLCVWLILRDETVEVNGWLGGPLNSAVREQFPRLTTTLEDLSDFVFDSIDERRHERDTSEETRLHSHVKRVHFAVDATAKPVP